MKKIYKCLAVALALCLAMSLGAAAYASGEPAPAVAPAAAATNEPAAAKADEAAVQEAYVAYIHEFLLAELAVNSNMTTEQIENEFMPGVQAALQSGDWTAFPVDMLFSGMLNTGVAKTYEEFAAEYVPTDSASGEVSAAGDTSKEAWKTYLKAFVDAVPAVSDDVLPEFYAAIDAEAFDAVPGDMIFNPTWWGYAAMTYDEFVAAGGAYTIPAFDPNLVPD